MEVRRGRPPHPGPVTPAEERVLQLVREGLTNAEIASRLGLALNTVKYHVANLLAKAGVDSREELRNWRPPRGGGLAQRAGWAVGMRWLGLGAGAGGVAALGLAGLLFAASVGRREHQPHGTALGTPDSTAQALLGASEAGSLALGPSIAPDRVSQVNTIAIVDSDGPSPSVAIVNTVTGTTLATRSTAYNPLVTFRRSHDELLLTHRTLFEGMTGREQLLEVLNLKDLSTKRVIPIPGRPEYTVGPGGAWQTLSNDERYFAVYSYDYREELPECQIRPADGPSCTRSRVRVIDLDSPLPDEVLYDLPRHCFGGLLAHGMSGFIATCADGYYLLEGSGPSVVSAGPEPQNLPDPVQARNLASAVHWLSPGDGWFGALMDGGSFVWSKAGEAEVSNRAVPAGTQLRWPIYAEIGGGRLVAGFVERYFNQYPEGLAVFNLTTGQVEETLPSFDVSWSIIAGGPDEVIATTQDGRLISITVSTGRERTIARLPARAQYGGVFIVR